jgi:hypothetical protein
VADVKDADGRADGHVLLDDAPVLDRHFEAGEGRHPSAHLPVDLVQNGPSEGDPRFHRDESMG